MGHSQIVEKLATFLSTESISDETRIIYLLVELRKVLDHAYNKKTDYLLLRFYCDWVVHTEKTQHVDHIASVVQKVYDGVKDQIEKSPYPLSGRAPIAKFIYMDELKSQMESLFKKENLPSNLFQKDQ